MAKEYRKPNEFQQFMSGSTNNGPPQFVPAEISHLLNQHGMDYATQFTWFQPNSKGNCEFRDIVGIMNIFTTPFRAEQLEKRFSDVFWRCWSNRWQIVVIPCIGQPENHNGNPTMGPAAQAFNNEKEMETLQTSYQKCRETYAEMKADLANRPADSNLLNMLPVVESIGKMIKWRMDKLNGNS